MYIFLIIVHVMVSLVLIAVILLQAGKGGSLAETFGGGAAQSLFGTSTSKVLTKATTICAVTFILTSIVLGVLSARKSESLMKSTVVKESKPAAPTTNVVPAKPNTTQPASTTTTPAQSEQPAPVPAK